MKWNMKALATFIAFLTITLNITALSLMCSCQHSEMDGQNNPIQNKDNNTEQAVELLYMGQGSLRIVTDTGKVIYIDPYAGEYKLAADLILVTHEHYDHNAVERVQNRQPDCRIIRSGDAIIDGKHQTFELGYVRVEAVEAGFNRYNDVRQCVGYVLTFTNGRKVYVSGDTSTTDQMHKMSDMHIDYAFLCTDGVYNMGNEEAARAAVLIGARHNIPYHNSTTGKGEMFSLDAAERFAAPNKLIIRPGETIEIK